MNVDEVLLSLNDSSLHQSRKHARSAGPGLVHSGQMLLTTRNKEAATSSVASSKQDHTSYNSFSDEGPPDGKVISSILPDQRCRVHHWIHSLEHLIIPGIVTATWALRLHQLYMIHPSTQLNIQVHAAYSSINQQQALRRVQTARQAARAHPGLLPPAHVGHRYAWREPAADGAGYRPRSPGGE